MNRRDFLKASAGVAGLALSVGAQDQLNGANERINVGLIGCGGQGMNHLHRLVRNPAVRVVGVCDIYRPRLENAMKLSGAPGFHDYRKLLDVKGLDAVFIATPDHWHARMGIDAMDAGKDVYQEKPMTRYWWEARDYYRAWIRTKRVVQVGSQSCSNEIWWKARDLIREGRIGKLVWAQTSICRNIRDGDWTYAVERFDEKDLDWNAFLGPAEKRPFDPERFFRWRKYWDYSGGIATDLFVHQLHHLCISLGNEFPIRAVAGGCFAVHNDRETPDTFMAVIDYPSRYQVVVAGTQANEQGLPEVIRGHEATMYLSGSSIEIRPENIYAKKRQPEKIATRHAGDEISAHHANFFDCLRRRDQRTNCDVELGYKVMVAVDMMVENYRQNRVFRFDPAKEEMVG